MQPPWGEYINLCSYVSSWSFQEQKWYIPQTNKIVMYDIKLLGMEFFLDHGTNTFTLNHGARESQMTTTFCFSISSETEHLQQHWTGAVLTQQWKCHPLRQEHHFLQHLGFLWRSPIKILNVSMFWTDFLFFFNLNIYFTADQITGYYKKWYQYDNGQMLLNSSSF